MRRLREKADTTWEVFDEGSGEYVEVEVTYSILAGDPGRYSGPPEDCYPAEAPEVEIEKVTLDGQPFNLPEGEEEKLIDHLTQNHEWDDGYDG